jgi:hypothetical protein
MAKPDNTQFYNPVKFSVYRNASYTTVSTTPTKLPFDSTEFDTGSNMTSSNKFTAPVAGFYQFNARFSVATSSTAAYIMLYKNGAEFKRGTLNAPNNQYNGMVLSAFVQAAASDFFEIYYVTLSALVMEVGFSQAYFQGYLISTT